MKYQVGIVDDHLLFSKSLTLMLESFTHFTVTIDVTSGEELQRRLSQMPQQPDIILLDVNMPNMGGVECATWLADNYPAIKVAALTMNDTDMAILAMIKAGCCSYMLKNTHPNELERALTYIAEKGYYNSDNNINFKKLLRLHDDYAGLTELEKKFLQFACSDFTYRQIAMLMNVSTRTIETCRMNVFHKLNVQSRTGMAMEALRRGLVEL
jgi:DNA-binding NarL/FixJ family response regulator